MVSFVIVTHSPALAEGVCEEARIMAPEARIFPAGGSDTGGIGSGYAKIAAALEAADSPDGVIILADMGSAVMTARLVMEDLEEMAGHIYLADCPLVEGAVLGTVLAASGTSAEDILKELAEAVRESKLGG